MNHTDDIQGIQARHTIRRSRSGDRQANLDWQPRRITRPQGEAAPRAKRSPLPRNGRIIQGRPVGPAEQRGGE